MADHYVFQLVARDDRREVDLGWSYSDWSRLLLAGGAVHDGDEPEQRTEIRDGEKITLGVVTTRLSYDVAIATMERETGERVQELYRAAEPTAGAPLPPFEARFGRPRPPLDDGPWRFDEASWALEVPLFGANPALPPRPWCRDVQEALARPGDVRALSLRGVAVPAEIATLPNLRVLRVDEAEQGIPEEVGYLDRLLSLALTECGLDRVPDGLGDATELRQLDLRQNRLQALPDTLRSLERLLDLDLASNDLAELPDWVGRLSRLRRLSLDYNKRLARLPPTVGQLGALERLYVRHCYALDVADALRSLAPCASLHTLDLSGTWQPDVFVIPAAVRTLTWENCYGDRYEDRPFCESLVSNPALRSLAWSAYLAELPDHVAVLRDLEELDLSHNHLTGLPAAMSSMRSLRRLRLSFNALASFPEVLLDMPALEALDLWGMGDLRSLPGDVDRMAGLRELVLDHTGIRELPPTFSRLRRLRKLSLGDRIRALPDDFGALAELEELSAPHVDAGSLVPLLRSGLPALRQLRIGGGREGQAAVKAVRPDLTLG